MSSAVQELGRFIREDRLRDLLGVSHASIWRWVRAGHFPRPVRIGQAAIAWPEDEVAAWMQARREERATAGAGT